MDEEDAGIEVPEKIYIVTIPCATCRQEFYVVTLQANCTGTYTCPDCKTLRLVVKTGVAARENDASSL